MARPRKVPTEAGQIEYFPVKLVRGYVPLGDFTVNGEEPTEEQRFKVKVGEEIELPIEEARSLIERGIAVRNDAI